MEKCENLLQTGEKNVWSAVAGAAVDYIEAQAGPVSKEEVVRGVIESKRVSLVPAEKIEELIDTVLFLFVSNGILINTNGVYAKRTIKDIYQGKNIQIEYRRSNSGKKKTKSKRR